MNHQIKPVRSLKFTQFFFKTDLKEVSSKVSKILGTLLNYDPFQTMNLLLVKRINNDLVISVKGNSFLSKQPSKSKTT